ncbi:hypothetical protein DFH09DRAFT_1281737 [Mycena vulgaris]|nr:hypothetical protein DFH09DRAFT_1281737 [Mycena vulgaris]
MVQNESQEDKFLQRIRVMLVGKKAHQWQCCLGPLFRNAVCIGSFAKTRRILAKALSSSPARHAYGDSVLARMNKCQMNSEVSALADASLSAVSRADDAHTAPYALSLQINERSTDAGALLVTSKQPLGPWLGRYLVRSNEALHELRGLHDPVLHSRASPTTSARPLSSSTGVSSARVDVRLRRHVEPHRGLRRVHAPLYSPSTAPAHGVPAIVLKLKSPEPRPHCAARLPHTQQGPQCMCADARAKVIKGIEGRERFFARREEGANAGTRSRGHGRAGAGAAGAEVARSLALPAYIFGFQTCRTRRAPALLKNTTNPSTALERPSSAPRVPPRAHAAAQVAMTPPTSPTSHTRPQERHGPAPRCLRRRHRTQVRRAPRAILFVLMPLRRASHGRDRGAQSSRTSSPRCARHPDDPVQEGPPRRSPARLLPLSWRSRTRVHTVPEERSSANHKAKQPRRWLAFRRAAVGARRTPLNAVVARTVPHPHRSRRARATPSWTWCTRSRSVPPSRPPRRLQHAYSPFMPRARRAARRRLPPTLRSARAPPRRRGHSARGASRTRRRRARRPSPARFVAGGTAGGRGPRGYDTGQAPVGEVRALAEPLDAGAAACCAAHERAVAPHILGDPSSGALGAAAYGARPTARIRRAGEDAELILEGLLQQLEAAVGAWAFRHSRCWRVCYLAPLQRLRPNFARAVCKIQVQLQMSRNSESPRAAAPDRGHGSTAPVPRVQQALRWPKDFWDQKHDIQTRLSLWPVFRPPWNLNRNRWLFRSLLVVLK